MLMAMGDLTVAGDSNSASGGNGSESKVKGGTAWS
jgi:hypothetical protein